ncbi:hypothetical protein HRG_014126 [Hirsutella rhossiliensis]
MHRVDVLEVGCCAGFFGLSTGNYLPSISCPTDRTSPSFQVDGLITCMLAMDIFLLPINFSVCQQKKINLTYVASPDPVLVGQRPHPTPNVGPRNRLNRGSGVTGRWRRGCRLQKKEPNWLLQDLGMSFNPPWFLSNEATTQCSLGLGPVNQTTKRQPQKQAHIRSRWHRYVHYCGDISQRYRYRVGASMPANHSHNQQPSSPGKHLVTDAGNDAAISTPTGVQRANV